MTPNEGTQCYTLGFSYPNSLSTVEQHEEGEAHIARGRQDVLISYYHQGAPNKTVPYMSIRKRDEDWSMLGDLLHTICLSFLRPQLLCTLTQALGPRV